MTRGGKREGAGRKKTLCEIERLNVGVRCQQLWRQEIEARLKVDVAVATECIAEEQAIARAIRPNARKEWLEVHGDRHSHDVASGLAAQQKLERNEEPNRILTIPLRNPKGKRDQIIAKVASEESVTSRITISKRFVDECWKEYRRYQKMAED